MKMQTKPLFIYLSIIILIGSLINFVPDKAVAAPPEVTLSLEESEIEVDVDPKASGQVRIFGSVKCRDHVQVIEVNLQAEAGDFATLVSPSKITLEPGLNEERFEIFIMVPNFSPVATYTITAAGSYHTIPGGILYELEPVMCLLKIKPFMLIRASPNYDRITLKPGDQVDISMTINNDGNYDEEFYVTLSDKNEAIVKDWQISIVPDTTLITQERSNQTFILKIKIPNDTPERNYLLIISIIAGDDSEGIATKAEYSLRINVQSDSLFSTIMWPWLVSAIVVVLLILLVIWKRKFILSKLRRNR